MSYSVRGDFTLSRPILVPLPFLPPSAGEALARETKGNTPIQRKPEVAWKRGLRALGG